MENLKTKNQQSVEMLETMLDQVAGRNFGDEFLDEQANLMTAIQGMLDKLYAAR